MNVTSEQLRLSGRAVYQAIKQHHPIKQSAALECWGHTLAGRSWSSLMAEAQQKRHIQLHPSHFKLSKALEHRRKSVSTLDASNIFHQGIVAFDDKELIEYPAKGIRKEAIRRLACYAMTELETRYTFDFDYQVEPEVDSGSSVFPFEIGGTRQVLLEWQDISFGEVSVNLSIPRDGAHIQDFYITPEDCAARCKFTIERQDGLFIQYIPSDTHLTLRQEGKPYIAKMPLIPQKERQYRFVDRVWM